jgi:hypothetical protein
MKTSSVALTAKHTLIVCMRRGVAMGECMCVELARKEVISWPRLPWQTPSWLSLMAPESRPAMK